MREHIKARRIADELIGYFLRNGVNNLKLDLVISKTEVCIHVDGVLTKEIKDLEEVVKMMNVSRVPEVEAYYANLLGADYGSSDMNLLGVMVDKASYERSEDRVKMKIIRYINDGS